MLAAECFLITASLNKYTLILSDMRPEERERDFLKCAIKKFDSSITTLRFKKKIIYFLVVLYLLCYAGYSVVAAHGLLIVVASLLAEHRL